MDSNNKFEIEGNLFTYEEFSKGEDIYIFLHGWCSIRFFWTPYFNDFSHLGNCYTLDVLGHFPSTVTSSFDSYTFEDIVNIQAKAVQKIAKDKKVNLIGHSTGGMFAIAIGILYPDLVNKSVAITPAVHGPIIGLLHFAKVLTDLKLGVSLDLFFQIIRAFPGIFHKWFEEAVYDKKVILENITNSKFVLDYHSHFVNLNPHIMGRYLQLLHNSDIRPIAKGSELNALIIGGSDDPIVPISHQRELGSLLNNARYIELSPCGHIPTLEKREETISIILDYLQSSTNTK